jgi:hypothetical protein
VAAAVAARGTGSVMSGKSSPFLKTYAALVVLAALGAYIYLIEAKKPESTEPAKEKALAIEREKVQELSIERPGAEPIRLVKQGEAWRLTRPVDVPADGGEVDSLLSSLVNLEIAEVVSESPAKLADFGLDPPKGKLSVQVADGGEPRALLLGDKSPDGSNLYAKKPAEARVFAIPAYLESSFDKKPFDLRDRDVLHVKRDAVRTLEVSGPEGSYMLNKDDKGEWSFLQPLRTRAGRWSVDGLLGTLEGLKMDSVAAEDAKDLGKFGLDKPARTVVLGLSDGGRKVLQLGKGAEFSPTPSPSPSPAEGEGPKPEGGKKDKADAKPKASKYYAREANGSLVAVVPATLADELAKGMGELRAKRLLEVATYEVEGIEAEGSGTKRVLARSSSKDDKQAFDVYKWKRTAPDAKDLDTNTVQDALFKIGGLEASEFVDAPGPLSSYGLQEPALRITLRYTEGKPPTWLEIGKKDGAAYGRRPDDAALLKLDPAKADELIKAFSEL